MGARAQPCTAQAEYRWINANVNAIPYQRYILKLPRSPTAPKYRSKAVCTTPPPGSGESVSVMAVVGFREDFPLG